MGLITDLASHHVRSVMKPKLLFIQTTYGSIVSISRIVVDVLFSRVVPSSPILETGQMGLLCEYIESCSPRKVGETD
jgi:hypothetical protein